MIPIRKAEIKDALAGVENTRAARACAETVDEPRKFFEWSELEN